MDHPPTPLGLPWRVAPFALAALGLPLHPLLESTHPLVPGSFGVALAGCALIGARRDWRALVTTLPCAVLIVLVVALDHWLQLGASMRGEHAAPWYVWTRGVLLAAALVPAACSLASAGGTVVTLAAGCAGGAFAAASTPAGPGVLVAILLGAGALSAALLDGGTDRLRVTGVLIGFATMMLVVPLYLADAFVADGAASLISGGWFDAVGLVAFLMAAQLAVLLIVTWSLLRKLRCAVRTLIIGAVIAAAIGGSLLTALGVLAGPSSIVAGIQVCVACGCAGALADALRQTDEGLSQTLPLAMVNGLMGSAVVGLWATRDSSVSALGAKGGLLLVPLLAVMLSAAVTRGRPPAEADAEYGRTPTAHRGPAGRTERAIVRSLLFVLLVASALPSSWQDEEVRIAVGGSGAR